MSDSIQIIPFANLALAFLPVIAVIVILWKWKLAYKNALYAVARMLIQLLLIGYFLAYIFESDDARIVVAVLAVMLFSSSWIALQSSLIPIINSLFAVGLVSLPGMMTGQILSGVSPFIAARYQIMVMCMVFGSAGISSAVFLILIKHDLRQSSIKKGD